MSRIDFQVVPKLRWRHKDGIVVANNMLGYAWDNTIRIGLREICECMATWRDVFPFVRTVIDGISSISVHELIHVVGDIGHRRNGAAGCQMDYAWVLHEMGYEKDYEMMSMGDPKARLSPEMLKYGVTVIDLD